MVDKLKELRDLIVSTNRGGYHRCSICNCVSNENIQTELGDYRQHMSFTNDPKDPLHFICIDCQDVIQDQADDYEVYDDIYGINKKEF